MMPLLKPLLLVQKREVLEGNSWDQVTLGSWEIHSELREKLLKWVCTGSISRLNHSKAARSPA